MLFIVVDVGYVRAMLGQGYVEWHVDCLLKRFPNAYVFCFDGAPGRSASGFQTRIAQRPQVRLSVGDLVDGVQVGVDEMLCRKLDAIARRTDCNHALLVSGDRHLAESFRGVKRAGKTASLVAIRRKHAINQSLSLRHIADRIWTFSSNGLFEDRAN